MLLNVRRDMMMDSLKARAGACHQSYGLYDSSSAGAGALGERRRDRVLAKPVN